MSGWAQSSAAALAVTLLARPAAAIEGGALDRTHGFAVAIVAGGPGAPEMRCTGNLVSANVVLTVRHCVGPAASREGDCAAELGAPEGQLWVGTSPWVQPGSGWHKVARVVVPETRKACGDDVALLVLDSPVPESAATPVRIAVSVDAFHEAAKAGVITVSGFGADDASGAGVGTRRVRGDIPLRCLPGEPGYSCGPELSVIDALEFTAGSGPCSGDSGAGALSIGSSPTVFGLLSRGKLARGCGEGVFERTDVWAWLVAKTILEAAPQGGAPAWASSLFPASAREGELCLDASVCGPRAACASLDDRRSWRCVTTCSSDRSCAPDQRCDAGLCVAAVASAPVGEGCRVGVARGPERGLVLSTLLAIFLIRRRVTARR